MRWTVAVAVVALALTAAIPAKFETIPTDPMHLLMVMKDLRRALAG